MTIAGSMHSQSLANMTEIKHLKEIFCSLTVGRLEIVTNASELVG